MYWTGLLDTNDVPVGAMIVFLVLWFALPIAAFFAGVAFQRFLDKRNKEGEEQ